MVNEATHSQLAIRYSLFTIRISPPMISAIILAAGESTRMGRHNKLLLPFGSQPLIRHIVRTVLQSEADEVIVVLGHQADQVREVLAAYEVTFALNLRYREGMTTSIQAGVQAASAETSGFMICLSDLPLIEPAELNQVMAAFREAVQHDPRHLVRPVHQEKPGHPVIFPALLKPAILRHQHLHGCQDLVKQNRALLIEVEMATDHVLRDIDTPDAYEALHPADGSSDS